MGTKHGAGSCGAARGGGGAAGCGLVQRELGGEPRQQRGRRACVSACRQGSEGDCNSKKAHQGSCNACQENSAELEKECWQAFSEEGSEEEESGEEASRWQEGRQEKTPWRQETPLQAFEEGRQEEAPWRQEGRQEKTPWRQETPLQAFEEGRQETSWRHEGRQEEAPWQQESREEASDQGEEDTKSRKASKSRKEASRKDASRKEVSHGSKVQTGRTQPSQVKGRPQEGQNGGACRRTEGQSCVGSHGLRLLEEEPWKGQEIHVQASRYGWQATEGAPWPGCGCEWWTKGRRKRYGKFGGT